MRYTLRIVKTQPDHLGDALPTQEFADRFDTPEEAADYARAVIAQHEAPAGAYSFDVVDGDGAPVEGYTGRED